MSENQRALKPEYLTRLLVERANAGDAKGVAEPYEEQAVMAHPPGSQMVGRDATRSSGSGRKCWRTRHNFEQEPPLPTLISGDVAITSTAPKDGAGARAQVARRQPEGSWLRLLDQPEFVPTAR